MRPHSSRAALVVLAVLLLAGCATPAPAPTLAPTVVAALPTQTAYPTSTAYPTYTPYPTATLAPTDTPIPPTPTATATATPTPTATLRPVTPRPVVTRPPVAVGSAELWHTPGEYPIAPQCATYGSSFEGRDWQETFCIIKVEIYPQVMRFYGHWDIRLVRGTPRENMYHPNSRGVTYVVDNLGNKYIPGRLGGAADADVKVYGDHYLLGYKDNDSIKFPHVPSAWWEYEPAKPGASSFTFVNDKYAFKIGPIVLSK